MQVTSPLLRMGLPWARTMTLRDMRNRATYERTEPLRRAYLFVARNTTLPDAIRIRAQQALHRLPGNSTVNRIRPMCLLTGKSRAMIPGDEFKMSQYAFKIAAKKGELPGVKKAVW